MKQIFNMGKICELILEIEKRPAAFITRNYLSCLKAFLDGWCYAQNNTESPLEDNMMCHFQLWIEKKYQISTSHSWCDIILFYHHDESEALKAFFKLFFEFIESSTETVN